MKHVLSIKPAIQVYDRHEIEDALERLGYKVYGGGTMADDSSCDISFDSGPEGTVKPNDED